MTDQPASQEKPIVLVVDDTTDNLTFISAMLKGTYRVKAANSGEKALRIAQSEEPPDIILLDIMMPGMDGYEVCHRLKDDPATRDIPVIFLTSMSEAADEEKGLSLGAVDYITKPASPAILLARLKTHLLLKSSADYLKASAAFLRDKNAYLEQEVERRTHEMQSMQDLTVMVLASLAETRDNDTGYHIRRTQRYVRALAEGLRGRTDLTSTLTDRVIDLIYKCAPLHDIGKVGIPDRVLLKPGRLDPDEYEIMKTHARLGCEAILQVERELGLSTDFLEIAKSMVLSHHERWDGKGYPEGLAGETIPLYARLMAVADVYDALITTRPYKDALPHEKAVDIIVEGRGSHFDPQVVDVFVEIQQVFKDIAARFADRSTDKA